MRALLPVILLTLILAATTGCGRKGPLYLPEPTTEEVESE